MIGYRYFPAVIFVCVVCQPVYPLWSPLGPRGFDYTPRFVNHGAAILASSKGVRCRRIIPHALCYSASGPLRVCGETRLEIASLHTLRKGK
jgi:hypothetical protein